MNVTPAEPVAKTFWVGADTYTGTTWVPSGTGSTRKSRVFGQYLENAFRLAPGGLVFIQKIVDEFRATAAYGQAPGRPLPNMRRTWNRFSVNARVPARMAPEAALKHLYSDTYTVSNNARMRGRDAGMSGFHEQAGAVEVQPDAFLPGEGGDAPHFVIAEHGVVHAPYRRLNANDADIRLYPAGAAAPHRVLHLR